MSRVIGWADSSIGVEAKPKKKVKRRVKPKKKARRGKKVDEGPWSDERTKKAIRQAKKDRPGIPADEICVCGCKGQSHDYRTRECAQCQACEGFTPKVTKWCKHHKSGDHLTRDCPDPAEAVAEEYEINLALECPVCRSLDPCECEEEDRSFQRRVRFEEDVKKVARCPRCQAPLSVLYLPRPGAHPPYRLSCFTSAWGCAVCNGPGIATIALQVGRARPHVDEGESG